MAAEAPDQTEGSVNDIPFGARVHLETTAAQSQALSAFGNEFTPKVRKPYTITKQREKWTDEEHQRFLEALKLYGRAWRQIEEHVGSKTAIQIRSHAQKFFAKVARESKPESESSLNPIEIPPPRPKKKPLYPYPRKVVDSQKTGDANGNPHEQSPLNVTSLERDTRSPTSVFSAIGSDTSGSPFSEPPRSSRLSPTSCTTDDAHSANVVLTENENECMTSNSSFEEEKGCLESMQVSPPTAMNAKTMMEPDLLTLSGAYLDDPATDESSTTIKLFGRMVMVNGSQKPSPSATENNEIISNDAANEKLEVRNGQPIQNFPTPNIDPKYAFAYVPGSITPLPCLVPQYALSEECSAAVIPGSIPWWSWYQGVVFPQVSFGYQMAVDSVGDSPCKRVQENEPMEEGSLTGSNRGSSSEVDGLQRKTGDIESKVEAKILKQGSAKGFVPYKRCLTERDVTSPIVSVEERGGQRARVCL